MYCEKSAYLAPGAVEMKKSRMHENLELSFTKRQFSHPLSADSEWPDQARNPINNRADQVGQVVLEDLAASTSPLIIAGYASLTKLIDFVVRPNACKTIRILFGHEPFPSLRQSHSKKSLRFTDEVTDYWMAKGVSLRESAKVIKTIEMLKDKRIEARIMPEGASLHAKIYVGDEAVTLGSSNFTQRGLASQLEANVRFQKKRETKRYSETVQVANNYWTHGEDYCECLVKLLEQLLKVVDWQEALTRACSELLEGEWAHKYLDDGYLNSESLWPSQRQGIAQALYILANQGSVLIADATGSGKTKLGVHLVGAIQHEVIRSNRLRKGKPILVSPPLVKKSWEQEIAKSQVAMDVVSQGTLSRLKTGSWEKEALQRAQVLCVDEGHNFLNTSTNRTRELFRNIADHVVLFTATPINRGVRDLLQIADLLGADNLQESTVESFKSLLGFRRGDQELTAEDVDVLRSEIQRFTVRRTKSELNRLIAQAPNEYVTRDGSACKFPEHLAEKYELNETASDCHSAAKIRVLAGKLFAVSHFEKELRLPARLKKQGWTDQQYLDQRLRSAKSLAAYAVMSALRSSRVALLEHIMGTSEACKQFGLKVQKAKTGNVLRSIYRLREKCPVNHLVGAKLPEWLANAEAHSEACQHDIAIYQQIKNIALEMSASREEAKVDLLLRLAAPQHHILAFDSRPLTLLLLKKMIGEIRPKAQVLLAFGNESSDRTKLIEKFSLESEPESVIGLCSDSLAEGVNLQRGQTVVHLDMPSVIRIAEQRVGRVDRMDSPHTAITAWWPDDAEDFRISSDDRFVERYQTVESLLGSNISLPAQKNDQVHGKQNLTTEELIREFEQSESNEWDGISDAFQPVRHLIEGDEAILVPEVYKKFRYQKNKVLCRVSLVKSTVPWAFFCVTSGSYGAPRWLMIDGLEGDILSDLEAVAASLRKFLTDGVENLPLTEQTAQLLDRFSNRLIEDELELLPKKKRRAYDELIHVLDALIGSTSEKKSQVTLDQLIEVKEKLKPNVHEDSLDWDEIASRWLDIVRPVWFEKLQQPRNKPLILKDIRADLVAQGSVLAQKIIQEFDSIPLAPRPEERIQACIIGVGS